MTEYVVNCSSFHNNKFVGIEISPSGEVYICCMLHYQNEINDTFYDEHLDNLPENLNSLEHNTMDDILRHYHAHINPEKWLSLDTCPPCCSKGCLKYEEVSA